jgi:hypothetical protein
VKYFYENILAKSQSKTRFTRYKTFRKIQRNKDSYKLSFFCRTIKDWNELPENITNNSTTDVFKEGLSHAMLGPRPDPEFQVRGGGALKQIAPSGGRRENCWGISCEKSRFYPKKSYFFQF